jgi:hypothetical protein
MYTATHMQNPLLEIQDNHYQDHLSKLFEGTLKQFDQVVKRHVGLNLIFFGLCAAELILLGFFFALLVHSLLLALSLSILFFTFFAYFTLRIYFQTKKFEQFKAIVEEYLARSKEHLHYQEGQPESLIALANACCKLANRLHAKEYDYYKPPACLNFLTAWLASCLEKISCWFHWQDIHILKELLLEAAVEEQIKHVQSQPTSLEAHAALANAYVMLSGLYVDPRKMEGYEEDNTVPSNKYDEKFESKFRATAERAIEEFKILSEYAPSDPWIHSQLAYSYHDLQMPLEEIAEYEAIQRLRPDDRDNLYKLGILYFQQGMNAKGLKIYEELKKAHYKKAENLIHHYGRYKGYVA